MVVFTKRIVRDKEDERASISMLKTYHVFNVEQIEGLPDHIDDTDKMVIEPIEAAERFITATKADIRLGGSKACYVPSHDFVALPPKDAFKNATNFYAIALHELGHNAAIRIMPHGLRWRLVSLASAMRLFGIIRALPRTRGACRRAGTGPTGWLGPATRASAFSFIRMSAWM